MDIEIDFISSLITCPECHIIFQYYDFLSHSYNSNCSININDNYIPDTVMDSNLDTEEPHTNTHTNTHTHTYTYNGLNDYGYLYNPMINRGFQNSNSDDSDNAIYILHNYLLSLNINASSNTTINNGLEKIELENNSKLIECNNPTDCPICLCNYPEHTQFYLMKCNHSFCIDCCETWFSKNSICPLCRKNYK